MTQLDTKTALLLLLMDSAMEAWLGTFWGFKRLPHIRPSNGRPV